MTEKNEIRTNYVKASAKRVIKGIRRATRKRYGPEEKVRVVLEGLRGEYRIAD